MDKLIMDIDVEKKGSDAEESYVYRLRMAREMPKERQESIPR